VIDDPVADPDAPERIVVERVVEVTGELVEAVRRLYPQLTQSSVPDERSIVGVLDAGASMVVARDDDAIVGMGILIIATALTGTTAHVEDVVVDAGSRGRGIGARLMGELLDLARAEGADQMTLTSHPTREAANRLYQRLGFQRGSTNYYSLDLDATDRSRSQG
jgi:ribosomal protein S18 acetylase RimI-like enzyme